MGSAPVEIENLSHVYKLPGGNTKEVLSNVSLTVNAGEIFGLLGPNGGGKTTLFKILSTALRPSQGTARITGIGIEKPNEVRKKIGVVFQSPSLDKKLTVLENVRAQGHLYGLSGAPLATRMENVLKKLSLWDRANDFVEHLSGGLQRRVEIAKGLLHTPAVLLMDEPSTGLDPGARRELWNLLFELKRDGVTILVTTHLMEEGDKCDRVGILHRGRLVALGTPDDLKRKIGGDLIVAHTHEAERLAAGVRDTLHVPANAHAGTIRIEMKEGHKFIPKLVETFPGLIDAVSVGKPTLEDVFVHETGEELRNDHE